MRKKKIVEQRDEARALVEELLPYIKDYVQYGLELTINEPDAHYEDDCRECQWNRNAIAWKARFDNGEIARILGKEEENV